MLANRCPAYLLKFLRQFSDSRHFSAFAEQLRQFRKCIRQAMRCLIENHRAMLPLQRFQNGSPLLFIRRQKALEHKASGIQTGKHQCHHSRRCTGRNRHRHTCRIAKLNQIRPRIRNAGHARIRHQCDAFPCQKPLHQNRPLYDLIMLMVACHGCFNLEMIQ